MRDRLEELTEDFGVTLKHMAEQSYKPLTNGDRIRAMTDEELAKFIPDWSYTNACKLSEEDCNNECEKCVAEWLKQPCEVET